ncbi:1,3-beta-glucan synthase component-domain-containing protein [Hysterangium stoloniferum]|nr:1,3-beta-glucan synthase component-domain-containing protein [Hysterangium stoloniferum]
MASIALWALVFGCKFTESYFFSFRDLISGAHDRSGCRTTFTLTIIMAKSFVVSLADIYTRLPKRIYAKILAIGDMEVKYKPKIWNAIILSTNISLRKLLYHRVIFGNRCALISIQSEVDGRCILHAPPFISQAEKGFKGEFFPSGSETVFPFLLSRSPVRFMLNTMPTFTVLTPHYSEKILLSLKEIIREEDKNTRVTLFEYLKQLQARDGATHHYPASSNAEYLQGWVVAERYLYRMTPPAQDADLVMFLMCNLFKGSNKNEAPPIQKEWRQLFHKLHFFLVHTCSAARRNA